MTVGEGAGRRRPGVLFALMSMVSVVVVTTAAVFTVLIVQYRTRDLMELVDARLVTAAALTQEMLGPDYHDRIVDGTSISKEEFGRIVARNDHLCRTLDLQYLWSVLLVDGRVVFTSATHSSPGDPNSPCAAFFETHRDPGAFAPALRPGAGVTYSSFRNEWGAGRMVLLPGRDARGRTWVFGASVRLTQLDGMVRRTVLASAGVGLAVMCGAFLLALLLVRSFTGPIERLTRATGRMAAGDFGVELGPAGTRELQSLTVSLDRMRQSLKRQLAELRESEARLELAYRMAGAGAWDWDMATERLVWSRELYALFGLDPGLDRATFDTWRRIIHPDDRVEAERRIERAVREDTLLVNEYRVVHPDGQVRWISAMGRAIRDDSGRPVRMSGICTDVTERKRAAAEEARLSAQLHEAQKMESVGRLAGGVAHDFNNMLLVISGYAESALRGVDPAGPLHEALVEIQRAAGRSADLTRQLLAFARRQTVTPRVLDLNETVAGTLRMLGRIIGEDVRLEWRPGAGLWPIKADPSQLDQVLANLCVNARDSIGGVGTVTIETRNVVVEAGDCASRPDAVPGDYVVLAVTDDGHGMDEPTMGHLFEPFFTTKEIGKGTGLGLATVYGIVRQNHGFICVRSAPEAGATFAIHLPRHEGEVEPARPPAGPDESPRGAETILLVEDEPAILDILKIQLEELGYTVLAAGSPGEALSLARGHAGEIHLLLTDVVMPEMNGRELAERLLSRYPGQKSLYMSGYTADIIADHGLLEEGVQFIQKPFQAATLAARLREVLDGG